MRRDPSPEAAAELLSAYVDGVSELTPEQRRAVEDHLALDEHARDDEAATRDLLGRLRELPAPGEPPDWAALERSIDEAVGATVPRSWWRRLGWRLVVPCMSFATAAAIILVVVHRPPGDQPATLPTMNDARPDETAATDEATIQLWLDGASVEVDLAAGDLLDVPWGGDSNEVDLLPASDLAWIDQLEGESLDRLEHWFARGAMESPTPPRPPRTKKRS